MKLKTLNKLEKELNYLKEAEELLSEIFRAYCYDWSDLYYKIRNSDIPNWQEIIIKLNAHFKK
jgi:hypothetical protein